MLGTKESVAYWEKILLKLGPELSAKADLTSSSFGRFQIMIISADGELIAIATLRKNGLREQEGTVCLSE